MIDEDNITIVIIISRVYCIIVIEKKIYISGSHFIYIYIYIYIYI